MDEISKWTDVGDRLATKGRGAQSRLARHLRIDPSYFSRKIKTATELTVTEHRQVTAWFEREPEADFASETENAAPVATRGQLKVFGYAATADGDKIAIAEDRVLDMLVLPPGLDLDPEEYFVVLPIGSSMEPRVFAGEPQIIRRNYPPGRDKKCLIEFSDGTAMLKAYRGQKDGQVFAEQYNPPKVIHFEATTVTAIHAVWMSL